MRSSKTSKRSLKRQSAGSRSKSRKSSKKSSKSRSKSKSKSSSSKKGKMSAGMCRCMKCKKPVKPADATKKTFPNGRCALTGKCPHCGTKVFTFCKC